MLIQKLNKINNKAVKLSASEIYYEMGGATLNSLLDLTYPIGSIYLSVSSTNPSNLFGGNWTIWGAGRVPVCVDTSQTAFNVVEKGGGNSTITLTLNNLPKFTVQEVDTGQGPCLYGSGGGRGQYRNSDPVPLNNLQPYITCYMWKRTA